jgi:phosphatidylserine decarboxylase
MRIHRKGWGTILVTLIILGMITWIINIIFPEQTWIHYILYVIGGLFFCLVIRFFRHPYRIPEINEDHVLSGADGTVVVIEEIEEDEYFKDKRIQVSVFMSPFNVHVNWYPISGLIVNTKYHKGRNYPAYLPKSSKENERQSIVVEDRYGREVMMIQIAGLLARRVFTNARTGNYVFIGEEAGIIKFGSRVDLILPANAEVKVKLHQRVKACKTVIAELPR